MRAEFPYDESDLLRRTSKGDVLAFRQLFDLYRNRVYHVARHILHSDPAAEDAVQEIFLKLWVHNRRLGSVSNFDAYLHTITRNHIYNVIRKQALEEKAMETLAMNNTRSQADAMQTVGYHELQDMVQKASSTLSVQQRRVFEMSRLEGKKHEQIASEMGLSRETVKKYLANALEKLQRYLVQHGRGFLLCCLLFFFRG